MTIYFSNKPNIYLLYTTLLLLQSSPAKLKVKYVYIERRYFQVVSDKGRFWILIGIVLISGFSQEMLLPTIEIIFEQHGISSYINVIHETDMYIVILLASPFIEKPMMIICYKPFIITGGILVFTSLFAFSLWDSIIFWFILRMIVGIGDQMLHFGSQTWITT